jgi:biopolymer transport protein ExbD
VDLPKIANQPTQTKPENITIAVSADGDVFWNAAKVPDENKLRDLIRSVAVQQPQPEIHIRGDKNAKYEYVGRVILAVQRGGVVKVGFITEPDRGFR